MLVSLLASVALLAREPDEAIVTAPETGALETAAALSSDTDDAMRQAAPHAMTTDEQIARWLAARAPAAAPWRDQVAFADDREPHASFTASVGTDGYSDFGAAVSLPVGETGRLDLSWRKTENGYAGYGYGRGWEDPALDDAGYAFPGYRPGAAAEFEWRAARPDGPPRRAGDLLPRPAT